MIKPVSNIDLDDYEYVQSYYPYMSTEDQEEMNQFIEDHNMDHDPTNMFYMVSARRSFVMVFYDSGHERDSSNDYYTVYRRRMN